MEKCEIIFNQDHMNDGGYFQEPEFVVLQFDKIEIIEQERVDFVGKENHLLIFGKRMGSPLNGFENKL